MKSLIAFITISICFVQATTSFAASKLSDIPSCGPGKHWVKRHFRRAYIRSNGTAVSAAIVNAHCSTNPPGYEHWAPLIHNGRPPAWPNSTEINTNWTEADRERLLEALSAIPKELWPSLPNGFFRMKKSKYYPNPSSTDTAGSIVFYDTFFDKKTNQSRVVLHEFAHLLYANDPELARNYNTASGWFDDSSDPEHPHFVPLRKSFVEPDGELSPSEDFANNFEYGVFDRKKLESEVPGVAIWFKNQYHDKLDFYQRKKK